MTIHVGDRIEETSDTVGTGTLALNGAVSVDLKSFVAALGNGKSCPYLIDDGAGKWELTWGVIASGTPDTITRGTLIKSSTGSRVDFGAGSKTVACVLPSELFLWCGESLALAESDIASATTTDLGTVLTFRARITGTTTVTGFGNQPNTWRIVRFAGALTLTHNATSLILLSGASRTTVANAIGWYESDASGNWREIYYSATPASTTQTLTSGSGATYTPTPGAKWIRVTIKGGGGGGGGSGIGSAGGAGGAGGNTTFDGVVANGGSGAATTSGGAGGTGGTGTAAFRKPGLRGGCASLMPYDATQFCVMGGNGAGPSGGTGGTWTVSQAGGAAAANSGGGGGGASVGAITQASFTTLYVANGGGSGEIVTLIRPAASYTFTIGAGGTAGAAGGTGAIGGVGGSGVIFVEEFF